MQWYNRARAPASRARENDRNANATRASKNGTRMARALLLCTHAYDDAMRRSLRNIAHLSISLPNAEQ
eukprot:3718055-Lingulodinium_polyedra.AAC.1